ncbi:hypothetical protein PT2222_240049 [Paraburkholderia tropica]
MSSDVLDGARMERRDRGPRRTATGLRRRPYWTTVRACTQSAHAATCGERERAIRMPLHATFNARGSTVRVGRKPRARPQIELAKQRRRERGEAPARFGDERLRPGLVAAFARMRDAQQHAEFSMLAVDGRGDLAREAEAFERIGGRRADQHVHEREDPGHERGIGEIGVVRRETARGEFHEVRARARELHERIGRPRQIASACVKQQLRPARDLARARSQHRLAQRRDRPPRRIRARIHEAQQLHHHARMTAQFMFERGHAHVARDQREQTHERKTRRAHARRAQHLRTREEVALEQLEAEVARVLEVLARLDLFGDQRLARGGDGGGQRGQFGAIGLQQIDLDDVRVRQRAAQVVGERAHVVECNAIAHAAQLRETFEHGDIQAHMFEHFEHEAARRQQMHDVVEQQLAAHVDVAVMAPEHGGHAELAHRARHHLSGGMAVVEDFGAILRAAAKQQLVGVQRAVAVEDRLPPEIDERLPTEARCVLHGLLAACAGPVFRPGGR